MASGIALIPRASSPSRFRRSWTGLQHYTRLRRPLAIWIRPLGLGSASELSDVTSGSFCSKTSRRLERLDRSNRDLQRPWSVKRSRWGCETLLQQGHVRAGHKACGSPARGTSRRWRTRSHSRSSSKAAQGGRLNHGQNGNQDRLILPRLRPYHRATAANTSGCPGRTGTIRQN